MRFLNAIVLGLLILTILVLSFCLVVIICSRVNDLTVTDQIARWFGDTAFLGGKL